MEDGLLATWTDSVRADNRAGLAQGYPLSGMRNHMRAIFFASTLDFGIVIVEAKLESGSTGMYIH
jgi:hypothetical protein